MSLNKNALEQPANNLLSILPPSDYERLVPHLKLVTLSSRQILHEAGERIAQVYFPHKAVVSIITTMEDGSTVEAGLISNEGMVGIPVILGDNITTTTALVQVPDSGMQMDAGYTQKRVQSGYSPSERIAALRARYVYSNSTRICLQPSS